MKRRWKEEKKDLEEQLVEDGVGSKIINFNSAGTRQNVRIMPTLPSFSSISPIYCKTTCPKHDVKRHNYALTTTTTTRGTCLWSRYPVLVIIRELEDSTSRPSVAS